MKEQKLKNFRHGDCALVGIDSLPSGLIASDTKVLMTGSGGNDHVVENGIVYPKVQGQFVIGYLEAKTGCKLLHPDHGEEVKGSTLKVVSLPAGCYELRRQNEDAHDGMKAVID